MVKKITSGIPGIIPPDSSDLLPDPIEIEIGSIEKKQHTVTNKLPESQKTHRLYNRRMLKR